ncbi:MAG TPA: transferrin receptor-like dimerization domain-containing protein [Thermoanaerobaculia bacterium]
MTHALLAALLLQLATSGSFRGFLPPAVDAQAAYEKALRAVPDPARMRESMRRLAAEPHHLGSPADRRNAEWIAAQLTSWGWDTKIETFEVLFPTPRERIVELLEPTRFTATLAETALPQDPTSSQTALQLPTYNAYSVDGDVTGSLVYVNQGVPADYERLEKMGVDVKGKIVIARYGGSWRGIKPKVAAEKGAIACLIYSDPKDDGYYEGEVYPAGSFRPPQGVQRGSVMDMPIHPGDPLTPGIGSTKGAKRLDRKDAQTLTKIPVLPIGYADARPLLEALTGPVAPTEWRGALPLTYRIGPGPAKVRVKAAFDWKIVPLHDVVATLKGSTWPDEWIVRGNHHDAWVNGAEDPISGLVAMLEEARAFGELAKSGQRPRRTLVYCAWDGEEQGLLGSTEFVEEHRADLEAKAVVYINSDSNGRGFLSAGGSHGLQTLVSGVAAEIEDPVKKASVLARVRANRIAQEEKEEERQTLRAEPGLRLYAMGSGSDYTPFLQHLGLASLNLGYGGEDDGGIYHSIYDDFTWYTKFSDGDFVYGRALAQTGSTIVARLANAEVLPFDFGALSSTVRRYVKEVDELAQKQRKAIEEANRQVEENVAYLAADPRKPFVAPKSQVAVPYFDLSPLQNAADALERAAQDYDKAFEAAVASGLTPERAQQANAILRDVERAFAAPEGLPKRPWFKHLLYAPGFYTGYAVKTLPMVREPLEQKQWELVNPGAKLTATAIERAAAKIRDAAEALKGPRSAAP